MPLKLINALSTATVTANGFFNEVTADLKVPGNPMLMAFCCNHVTVALRQKRQQTVMGHGNKLWFGCIPLIYVPISQSGNKYTWSIARCQCGVGTTVTYVIGEFGAPPILQWHSLPHKAIACDGVEIFAQPLGQFVPISFPPGGPLTGAGIISNDPLEWVITGCVLKQTGNIRITFDGIVKGSPLGPPATTVTMEVTKALSVIDHHEFTTENWPTETHVTFTTYDTWTGIGPVLYEVTAGYDPSQGLGGAQGSLTFTWLPP